MNQRIKQTLIQMLLLGSLAPRASWGPENEDQEALGTQDLKSQMLGLPVICDYCRSEETRILPLTFESEVTRSPKIQDFKSCVPRASWSLCSQAPRRLWGRECQMLRKFTFSQYYQRVDITINSTPGPSCPHIMHISGKNKSIPKKWTDFGKIPLYSLIITAATQSHH